MASSEILTIPGVFAEALLFFIIMAYCAGGFENHWRKRLCQKVVA